MNTTNEQRAAWAEAALTAFCKASGSDGENSICDLLADLGHLCDAHGSSLHAEMDRAKQHYDEESDGIGTQFNSFGFIPWPNK